MLSRSLIRLQSSELDKTDRSDCQSMLLQYLKTISRLADIYGSTFFQMFVFLIFLLIFPMTT